MERFRVTLSEGEVDERQALRQAFVDGSAVQFRGRRVTVWGEFVDRRDGPPREYVYEVEPER